MIDLVKFGLAGPAGEGEMMRKLEISRIAAMTTMALLASAVMAHAQATRTWVSGVGDDANPCSRTAPCKTFAGAISKTAPGGEINVLDPGGFGAVTITKSISIESQNIMTGVLVSGTNGIVIAAGANDVVMLRGLTLEGLGTGLSGVKVLSAGNVYIEDCFINNFNYGVDVEPAAPATAVSVSIKNTNIRTTKPAGPTPNGFGVYLKPTGTITVQALLDHVRSEGNFGGLRAEANVKASVRDSVLADNTGNGAIAIGTAGPVEMNFENVQAFGNQNGIVSQGSQSTVRISNTSIFDNSAIGFDSVSSGITVSFGNNRILGNGTNGLPTGTTTQAQQ